MQRLTATMKFTEGVPSSLVDQTIKQFCADYPERYLLASYGYLGENHLLSVRTDAEKSRSCQHATSSSALPSSERNSGPDEARARAVKMDDWTLTIHVRRSTM